MKLIKQEQKLFNEPPVQLMSYHFSFHIHFYRVGKLQLESSCYKMHLSDQEGPSNVKDDIYVLDGMIATYILGIYA